MSIHAQTAFRILPLLDRPSAVLFRRLIHGNTRDVIDARAVAVHGLLLNNMIDSAKPNGTFWSIAVDGRSIRVSAPVVAMPPVWRERHGPGDVLLRRCGLSSRQPSRLDRCAAAARAGQPEASSEASASHTAVSRAFRARRFWRACYSLRMPELRRVPWMAIGSVTAIVTMLLLWLAPTAELEAASFGSTSSPGSGSALLAGLVQHPQGMGVRLLSSKISAGSGNPLIALPDPRAHRPKLSCSASCCRWDCRERTLRMLLAIVLPAALAASRLFWPGLRTPFIEHRSLRGRPRRVLEPTRSRLNNRGNEE